MQRPCSNELLTLSPPTDGAEKKRRQPRPRKAAAAASVELAAEQAPAAPKKRTRKPADPNAPKKPRAPRKSSGARKSSHVQSVGADALLYVPGRVLPAIVQILTVPVLTYFFAVEEIGRYDLTFRFILFLSTFTFMWLNMAILRFYAPYQAKEDRVFAPVVGLVKYVTMAVGVALAVALYFSNQGERFGVYRDLLLPGIAVFVGYTFFEVGLAHLRAKRKPIIYSLATTLNAGFRLPLTVGLIVWAGMGIESMLWSMAATYFLAYAVAVQRQVGRPGALDSPERRKLFKEILQYGLPIWLTQVLNFFVLNADRWFITAFATAQDNGLAGVGMYAVATTLIDQPMTLVFQTLSLAVFPGVVAVYEREGKEASEALVAGLTRIYILLCMPLVVCFIVLARPLFTVLAKGDAASAYIAAPWIAIASFFYGLSYFASFGLHLSKRTGRLLAMTVLALAANIGANIVLIPMEGFLGAAHARLLSNFVLTAAVAAASYRYLRWRTPLKSFVRIFLAAVLAGCAAWGTTWVLPSNLLTLAAEVAVGGVSYVLLLLLFGEVNRDQISTFTKAVRTKV